MHNYGDLVKINKRTKEKMLIGFDVRIGDTGIVISNLTSLANKEIYYHVKFFNGTQIYVRSYILSKVKGK